MKGAMIIKEILACVRGRGFSGGIGAAGRRQAPFRMSFLTRTQRNGLFLGFLFCGNEATLPP